MKLQIRLDKDTIQEFLLDHAEKIVMGAVVACSLVIIYRGATRETFSKTPADLSSRAQAADRRIKETPGDSRLTVINYEQIAKRNRVQVEVEPYKFVTSWFSGIIDKAPLRQDPKVLLVQKLRGESGMGAFELEGNAKGGGQRWIVITGLVPIARQIEAFEEAFRNAEHRTANDAPAYRGFYVQRAEVPESGSGQELQWEEPIACSADRKAIEGAGKTREGQEVVDKKYVDAKLTFPLGVLVSNQTWGAEVAHPPEIPLVKEKAKAAPAKKTAPAGKDSAAPFGEDIDREKTTADNAADKEADKAPQHLLLRFFDFTVLPKKRYRYRVRLVLKNPNQHVDVKYLASAEYASKPILERAKDWSEPTEVIAVQPEVQILVRSEPLAKGPAVPVRIRVWDPQTGRWRQTKKDLVRGQVADFVDMVAVQPKAGKERTEYFTGATAVDFTGGQRMFRSRQTQPIDLLMLEPDGSLVIHSELEDREAYQEEAEAPPEAGEEKEKQPTPKPKGKKDDLEGLVDP